MAELPPLQKTAAAVLLAFLLCAGMTYYHFGVFLPRAMQRSAAQGLGGGYSFGNDFYPIWLTARKALLQHQNPYSPEITREIQIGLFGRALEGQRRGDPPSNYRTFAYPAFVDLLFWPFSLLPFPLVRTSLAVAFAALTAISVPLWLRALQQRASPPLLLILILFTLSSYAVLEGLFALQVGLVAGFFLAASLAALTSGRPFLAGSLVPFTLIKPQMSALIVVYLLLWSFARWHERRCFVYGFLAWAALLIGLPLLVWPGWIPQWLHVLMGYGDYSTPSLISYVLGPRLGPLLGSLLIVALLAVAVVLMWRKRRVSFASPSFMLTVSLLLALTSITLLPGQAVYDHVILLPGILVIWSNWRDLVRSSRAFGVVLAAATVALFWQWIAAIPLLGLKYFLSPAQFFSESVFLLPYHAGASIPFGVLAVLRYMTRNAMRETGQI